MTKEQADKSFDTWLSTAPARLADALVWVRDNVGMARRMLEAEGVEVTADAVVQLVRLVDGRERELYAREKDEQRERERLEGTHLRSV